MSGPESAGEATARERRATLCAALESGLPDNFKWNFGLLLHKKACGTVGCALGLASIIFDEPGLDMSHSARFFDLPHLVAREIFLWHGGGYDVASIADVTPEMVARKLRDAPYASARAQESGHE